MIPQKITLESFMPYGPEPTTLDLSGIHLACLAGANGHGKSAIIDAITWALWGKARARRDDELIHLGQEQMSVSFEFMLADARYRVIRQRNSSGRGSSALEFQLLDGDQARPLTGDTLRDTEQVIIDTLHMDYPTFINSALLLQGRADEFTSQPPGERKRILGEILGLSLYDELEERAKERSKSAEVELARIQAAAGQIQQELEREPEYRAELEQAERAVAMLEVELEQETKELRQIHDRVAEAGLKKQALSDVSLELVNRQKELEDVRRRMIAFHPEKLTSCEQQLTEVRTKLASLAGREADRGEKESLLRDQESRISGAKATNRGLKTEMENLRDEMEILQGAEAQCPLCGTELTPEHRDGILAEKQRKGKVKATSYRANEAEISELENGNATLRQDLALIAQDLAEAAELQQRQVQLSQTLAELKAQADRVVEWGEQAVGLEQIVDDLSDKRDRLEKEFRALEEVAAARAGQELKVRDLEQQASQAKLRLGAAHQKLDHCRHLETEREKLQDQHDAAGRHKALYDELRLAFGKRGIQAMIIETIVPQIEEEANSLLEQMTDGQMHVAFQSQRETKKGTLMETLDIEVSDSLGSRNYDLFSGGEAFRINFAIRIAISKLLAQRAGARLQTLIIDEGFGSQDGQGRDRLVEAINSVRDEFALILVVTHIDELMGAFPNRIDVVKGPGGSMISVN